jgi:hypothetical protein
MRAEMFEIPALCRALFENVRWCEYIELIVSVSCSNKTKFYVLVCKTKVSIMLFESHLKNSLKRFFLVLREVSKRKGEKK